MSGLPIEVLSQVLCFAADHEEIPRITSVCKKWKSTLDALEQQTFENLMKKYHPHLAEIIQMCPIDYNWKDGYKIRVGVSNYTAIGRNQELQLDFETVFRPLGITAFSNCYHYHCSDSYNECHGFQERQDDGIYFIRFHLNGMNADPETYRILAGMGPIGIAVSYGSLEYLDENWEQECQLMKMWCAIVGLSHEEGECSFHKPENIHRCIMISYEQPIELEKWTFSDDDDDSSGGDSEGESGDETDEAEY